jgi:hypothetical protein
MIVVRNSHPAFSISAGRTYMKTVGKETCPGRECDLSTMAIEILELHIFNYFSGINLCLTISMTKFSVHVASINDTET